jgi:hypothetical protein
LDRTISGSVFFGGIMLATEKKYFINQIINKIATIFRNIQRNHWNDLNMNPYDVSLTRVLTHLKIIFHGFNIFNFLLKRRKTAEIRRINNKNGPKYNFRSPYLKKIFQNFKTRFNHFLLHFNHKTIEEMVSHLNSFQFGMKNRYISLLYISFFDIF